MSDKCAETVLPIVNRASNEPSMSDIMASIHNIIRDDDSMPSLPARQEVPPKTWLEVLADTRADEKAFVEQVAGLLGDDAQQFDLVSTINVTYDGGSFTIPDVKDYMRLARELGSLTYRGWFAAVEATCASGAGITFKVYGPIDGEWTVNVRGGDCLIRTRKFTDRQELSGFLSAVVPGLLTWKSENPWQETMPAPKCDRHERTWLGTLRDVRAVAELRTTIIANLLREMDAPGLEIKSETLVGYDSHIFRLDAPEHDIEFAEELEGTVFTHARTSVIAEIGKSGRLTIGCSHAVGPMLSRENWTVEIAGGDFRIRTRSFSDVDTMSSFAQRAVSRLIGRRLSIVR